MFYDSGHLPVYDFKLQAQKYTYTTIPLRIKGNCSSCIIFENTEQKTRAYPVSNSFFTITLEFFKSHRQLWRLW